MNPPDDLILRAYFGEDVPASALRAAIDFLKLDGAEFGDGHAPKELDAAVADVLLRPVRSNLPQWGYMSGDDLVSARRDDKSLYTSSFLPQHLFTINWADSGPGFPWPMAYHATVVQPFGRVVVTASADSPEAEGFCDFAIGSFPIEQDFLDGVRAVVVKRWSVLAAHEATRWTRLLHEGLVKEQLAQQWADAVWAPQDDDADNDWEE